jgi:hypothetical protein
LASWLLSTLLLGVPKQAASSGIAKQPGSGLLGLGVAEYCILGW